MELLTDLMTNQQRVLIAEGKDDQAPLWYRSVFYELIKLNIDVPVILKKQYTTNDIEAFLVQSGADMGTPFCRWFR